MLYKIVAFLQLSKIVGDNFAFLQVSKIVGDN